MTDTTTERDPRWAELTKPFPVEWIEKLPKQLRRGDEDRGRCTTGSRYTADGHTCNGYHARAVHLDYVGHAGITMRLNDAVGPENWSWEPMALDSDGMPIMGRSEFWIRLTILGVTKYGVGDDFNGSAKQAIGDALRNAAMRFGIGTYLWSKSEAAHALAANADDSPADRPVERPADAASDKPMTARTRGQLFALFAQKGIAEEHQLGGINQIVEASYESRADVTEVHAKRVIEVLKQRPDAPVPAVPTEQQEVQ